MSSAPIGVFDSGIGGMTVARALTQRLPHERLVYFGDTAHLPYGDKSAAAIQAYSVKICDVLLQHGCKVILIACNSASAAAFDLVKAYIGSKAHALNVIDPTVQLVRETYAGRHVGLIGTKQTVGSGVYDRRLDGANVDLVSLATPLLAPMIEDGFVDDAVSNQVIKAYLDDPSLERIEALVLACTHYPLIAPQIRAHYAAQARAVDVLDSSDVVARHVEAFLTLQGLAATASTAAPEHRFFVSDYTDGFEATTRLFFGQHVDLVPHLLWE